MTFEEFKQAIEKIVVDVQGCKEMELAVRATELTVKKGEHHDFMAAIQELISEGRLEEVQYVLPEMGYRIKSFILPGGTEILDDEDDYDQDPPEDDSEFDRDADEKN